MQCLQSICRDRWCIPHRLQCEYPQPHDSRIRAFHKRFYLLSRNSHKRPDKPGPGSLVRSEFLAMRSGHDLRAAVTIRHDGKLSAPRTAGIGNPGSVDVTVVVPVNPRSSNLAEPRLNSYGMETLANGRDEPLAGVRMLLTDSELTFPLMRCVSKSSVSRKNPSYSPTSCEPKLP